MKHLDVNVTLKDQTLKLDHDSNEVIVKWPDGHESRFRARFLAKYGRNGTSGDHQGYFDIIQPKLWESDFQILRHQYNDIVHCDKALFNWLHGTCHEFTCVIGKINDKNSFRFVSLWFDLVRRSATDNDGIAEPDPEDRFCRNQSLWTVFQSRVQAAVQ